MDLNLEKKAKEQSPSLNLKRLLNNFTKNSKEMEVGEAGGRAAEVVGEAGGQVLLRWWERTGDRKGEGLGARQAPGRGWEVESDRRTCMDSQSSQCADHPSL